MRSKLIKPSSSRSNGFFAKTGNQSSHGVQAKLKANKPGGYDEIEADKSAENVVGQPMESILSGKSTLPGPDFGKPLPIAIRPSVRLSAQSKEEDLQTKELTDEPAGSVPSATSDQKLIISKRNGAPLPTDVQSEMEPGFRSDFSSVQVHTGTQPQEMIKEIAAQAFTHKAASGKEKEKKELSLLEVNTPKEQHPVMVLTSEVADGKVLKGQNNNAEAVSNVVKQEVSTTTNVTNAAGEATETSNVTGLEEIVVLDNPESKKVNESTKKEKDDSIERPSLNEFENDPLAIDTKQFKSPTQEQLSESKADQAEPITTEPNVSSQKDLFEQKSNKDGKTYTGTLLKIVAKEPFGASQQDEEMEDTPTEQGSPTPKAASASVVESESDQVQEIDPEVQEGTEISEEGIQQSDAEQESMSENVSAAATEMIIHLDDLEKSHTESLSAYRKITQKNIRTLSQQSEKALQSCDSTYYQQVSLIDNGYGNAIRKVKKALSTTLSDLSKGKSARRKKLTSIVESKVKKTGYLTWNKQQQADVMGREFAGKAWTYTTELKNDSNKKAYDQKQEIKANGADAKLKYKNHKYKADVDEAVNESVLDYCESINESTADLKATLNEDAGGMATNFKNEASDLKALLPQGKQRVIQNIHAIGREGAKEFNKVDQDLLPSLRKQMFAAEAELHQARKKDLIALKNTWMQSRQGIKEQQKQLELKLRNSEKQAVEENKQVMAEVRAEHNQDRTMESQLGEMDTQMKKSPGELAAAQQNLLKQGGVERQKGVRWARQGMTMLGSGSVKQAQKMADTSTIGAAKMKAGALKGYDQVVKGTENGMNDELSRYEKSLDKILGDARSDWRKKLGEGKWGMRKKAHGVWYENGKLRKESRSELFAVAKDASQVDFWDVLEAIGYFLLGVLAVLALILLVLVVIWAFGALLASLGAWLVAATAQYAIGALVAALVVSIEMLITGILTSAVFWVGASAYGIYTGYEKIKEAKNNPNLIRKDAAYEYGFGTAEIVLSLLPFWGKFKGRKGKGGNSKTTPKPKSQTNYENHGGEFDDDFARMGTQQEPPVNKPSATNKPIRDAEDFATNKKSDKFVESSLDGGDFRKKGGKTTSNLKSTYKDVELGSQVGSGGNKIVYEIAGEPDKVIAILKKGGLETAITEEITLLNKLQAEGLSTVKVIEQTTHRGKPAVVMKRYAQGSKDVVRLVKGSGKSKVEIVGKSEYLTEKSIQDLQKIKSIMLDKKIQIDDLQFLIGKDGSIVIADPLKINMNVPPSKNNLRMINLLITAAQSN